MAYVDPSDPIRRVERVYQLAKREAARKWGSAGELLGPQLRYALVAQELLALIAAQDESLPADLIRKMVDGGWENLNADPDFN